jgi:pimeloyl-CoA synthetase
LIFLLLQKRIFGSYYWEHIVAELRSQAKLASQGAVLFNEISHKRIDEDREREEQTVTKITRSLKRIKEQQLKLIEADSKAAAALAESSEHFQGLFEKIKI